MSGRAKVRAANRRWLEHTSSLAVERLEEEAEACAPRKTKRVRFNLPDAPSTPESRLDNGEDGGCLSCGSSAHKNGGWVQCDICEKASGALRWNAGVADTARQWHAP